MEKEKLTEKEQVQRLKEMVLKASGTDRLMTLGRKTENKDKASS